MFKSSLYIPVELSIKQRRQLLNYVSSQSESEPNLEVASSGWVLSNNCAIA
jgi:hypothetical protein